jgi:hypothetical protein
VRRAGRRSARAPRCRPDQALRAPHSRGLVFAAAWAHRSGEGFNVVLNFLPPQGQKIVMRVNEPKDDE